MLKVSDIFEQPNSDVGGFQLFLRIQTVMGEASNIFEKQKRDAGGFEFSLKI